MVVELLTFTIAPEDRAGWLDVEERTWSRFLERQPGFVGKQVWADREHPDRVHCVITWADQESWDAITADAVARVDAEMGEWFRASTMRAFEVIRDR
jgi:uncharacterized protein (TIGR03792 family)